MGGHVDDAEDDMTRPIVSCSFGSSAIFLIGGRTVDTEPWAMWVRSGDVVLMGGESRYCVHGIPRVMDDTTPTFLKKKSGTVSANIPGKVVTVEVAVGDEVVEGQVILILEAMKMQNEIQAPVTGTVISVHCDEGEAIEANVPLVVIEPIPEPEAEE